MGVTGAALERFKFYLNYRTFSVSVGDISSASAVITCRSPMGLFLGLYCSQSICYLWGRSFEILTFLLTVMPIILRYINPADHSSVTLLATCMADGKSWIG